MSDARVSQETIERDPSQKLNRLKHQYTHDPLGIYKDTEWDILPWPFRRETILA